MYCGLCKLCLIRYENELQQYNERIINLLNECLSGNESGDEEHGCPYFSGLDSDDTGVDPSYDISNENFDSE